MSIQYCTYFGGGGGPIPARWRDLGGGERTRHSLRGAAGPARSLSTYPQAARRAGTESQDTSSHTNRNTGAQAEEEEEGEEAEGATPSAPGAGVGGARSGEGTVSAKCLRVAQACDQCRYSSYPLLPLNQGGKWVA